jgi:sigma-B regulation protein RsbU (phosphoserine phosphatase)
MSDLSPLRADLPRFVLGTLVMAVGLGSLALAIARRAGRDLLLVSFAAFAGLYGLRLAVGTAVTRDVVGLSPRLVSFAWILSTYWIGPASALFLSQFFPRWRPWLTGLTFMWLAYALSATCVDLIAGRPGLALGPNPYLVLASMALAVLAMAAPGRPADRELQVLRGGGLVLLVFVVNENLGELGLRTVRGVEAYGFLVFVAALGYVAVSRVFANERRLLALAQELETARRIQASILPPRVPKVDGLRVAVRYEPMTAVAGDFYDFARSSGRLGLLVADVSGHGIPAALVASMVKVAFEAQGSHADQPAAVLQGMNGVLCRTLDGPFVTAVYVDLEPASGRIRVGGAGHPPALLLRRREGTTEALLENGLVMGFDGEASYTAIERQAGPGDRLLLFTDGVIEATSRSDEPFGLERLAAALRTGADLDAGPLTDRILAELQRFRGGVGFEDDVTLAVVDFTPPSPARAEAAFGPPGGTRSSRAVRPSS